jgi:TPR repeat protein
LAGVLVDRKAAEEWYLRAAEQLHIGALSLLTGVAQSSVEVDTEARAHLFSLWLRAATAGNETAQARVGNFFLSGFGVEPSPTEAVRWLRRAASTGNLQAQLQLAGALLQGKPDPGAYEEALSLLRQAASKGNADAEYNLGVCYRRGLGVAPDRDQARRHYHSAAIAGNRSAQLALGDLLVEMGDDLSLIEAARWYEYGTMAGVPGSFFGLARLYEQGKGVHADSAKATLYYRKAAESGHEGARQALARLNADVTAGAA